MRALPYLLLVLISIPPTAAAFPIESGVVIEQGSTDFYLAPGVTLETDRLTFAADGSPIYDNLLLGYTSSTPTAWTIQLIDDRTVVLNSTTPAPGTMRFAGWQEYEVRGVAGKRTFERNGDTNWPVGTGAQTVTITKLPSMAERLTSAMSGIMGVVVALSLLGIVILLLVALQRRKTTG